MFQTVTVRRDGTGEVGQLIGEISGVKRKPFRLTRAQFAQLRRLLAEASRAPHNPHLVPSQNPFQYQVLTRNWDFVASKGHVPAAMAGLVNTLSGLIDRYP